MQRAASIGESLVRRMSGLLCAILAQTAIQHRTSGSAANRTLADVWLFTLRRPTRADGEAEGRARTGGRLYPDAAPMALDDLLADRQANARARVVGPAMEALEDDKDALPVLRVDANPIVPHRKAPRLALPRGRDVHTGRLRPTELEGVAQEILEELGELRGVARPR